MLFSLYQSCTDADDVDADGIYMDLQGLTASDKVSMTLI